ncbi:MAG: DUF547 domain-containing protein [Flammeovirgaceae bacterium]|nr:DUF547 domain-containing protein [Flammeovirgaceae bacterium]MBE63101.1 DUF547 domain-containing protein [Flammeovirgaceae bacterium]MBR09236.1 DUF547 domain-containing protein [Rickettsiales bacterium]|tara:strand:- start:191 stop:913 length:723 start_codon:yes stop_codon:yes gene_type:complete
MKFLSTLLLVLATNLSYAQSDEFFVNANQFFQTYVKHGLVDYEYIKVNSRSINQLTDQIANYLVTGKDPVTQKAFYTNAYNILVIKQVVDNLPINGPWDVDGFFDTNEFEVAGRMVTLDELEKDILFSAFPDPRLHFVLVCAAIGCPPIANYAFVPDSLESTLENKTIEVLNIDWYVRVSKRQTAVSQVFEWYRPDFVNDTTTILDYVNQYRIIKIPSSHEVTTYEYNWELNDSNSEFRY